MSEPRDGKESPPEPSRDVVRAGQAEGEATVILSSGLPPGSGISGFPQILLEGARDAVHSGLTWKLLSRIFSASEDERDALRAERDAARSDTEKWRQKAEQLSGELIDARARWDSVSTLTSAQALMYVVGGILLGPAVQGIMAGSPDQTSIFVGLLGLAGVCGGYLLGSLGPKGRR